MFTSPHLKAVNERIQVNSVPISEDAFARYFWEVWDRLDTFQPGEEIEVHFGKEPKPPYFRFLTLMAWHAFLDMKVHIFGFSKLMGRLIRQLWRLGLVGNMILRML
jgi:folylpolyglutamate synthase